MLKGSLPKGEDSFNCFTFINGEKISSLPAAYSCGEAVDTILAAVVAEVSSNQGSLQLLEKKLVMLSNEKSELPSDGEQQLGSYIGLGGMAP